MPLSGTGREWTDVVTTCKIESIASGPGSEACGDVWLTVVDSTEVYLYFVGAYHLTPTWFLSVTPSKVAEWKW